MTADEFIDNNKLIAEFMGHDVSQFYVFIPSNGVYKEIEMFWEHRCGKQNKHGNYEVMSVGQQIPFKSLWYHKSWDWLMPVVEKIEEIAGDNSTETIKYHRFCVDMSGCFCSITDNQEDVLISECDGGTKLRSTFLAVVEFIEWYNKNKK